MTGCVNDTATNEISNEHVNDFSHVTFNTVLFMKKAI